MNVTYYLYKIPNTDNYYLRERDDDLDRLPIVYPRQKCVDQELARRIKSLSNAMQVSSELAKLLTEVKPNQERGEG